MFVDTSVTYAAVLDRDRVMTVVYETDGLVYAKRFPAGGMIMNREYRFLPRASRIGLFADDSPATLYVRYVPTERQQIRQQEYDMGPLPSRDRDTRGVLMTSKPIDYIGAAKPSDWDDALTGPPGRFKALP